MPTPNLQAAASHKLTDDQLETLRRCGQASPRPIRRGDTLFDAGDRDFKFFLIKSGEIEIRDPSDDQPRTVLVQGPGEFTGEVAHLTGSPAPVSAVARSEGEVYEISGEGLRRILGGCPDLGDLILQTFIARRQLLRESGTFSGLRVIGSRYSRDTFRIRNFLAKNRMLFAWLDLEADPQVQRLLQRFGISPAETPVVVFRDLLLRNPTDRQLADAVGIHRSPDQAVHDLVIVGAGPAGLAAAVYGATEGLSTVVLERLASGGQAGGSMRIENYLGFPTGVTGADLADRALLQAIRSGAVLSIPARAVQLRFDNADSVIDLDDGSRVVAKCVLIATGADYRKLDVEGCERFEGSGVYYAATRNEAQMCVGTVVAVAGGGNSAGQAAVFLAAQVRQVYLLVRGDALDKSMSSYLVRRIQETKNIEVLLNTTVKRLGGERSLESIEIADSRTGETRTLASAALFSFIGAVPRTDWLSAEIVRDDKGFVKTGADLTELASWPLRRPPLLLETSHPGVFAAGDVRYGSVKRVASAVGEGAMAVQFVHEYRKER